MPFPARYAGHCHECHERIEPGEPITYDDDRIVHADCDAHYEAVVAHPVTICPTCHLTKPCDCEAS
jgi:hypothetical protein